MPCCDVLETGAQHSSGKRVREGGQDALLTDPRDFQSVVMVCHLNTHTATVFPNTHCMEKGLLFLSSAKRHCWWKKEQDISANKTQKFEINLKHFQEIKGHFRLKHFSRTFLANFQPFKHRNACVMSRK